VNVDRAAVEGSALVDWVPEVVARIVDGVDPRLIVLFGSVARGEDGPDSDIDLLVVLDRIEDRRHDAAVAILRLVRGLPVAVDVFPVDQAGLEASARLPGVVRVALAEGRVVHDRAY